VDRLATAQAQVGEPTSDDDAEAVADRQLIESAFLTLTPAHRAIVVLHHYADLPLAEVAAIAGVAPGTARSRLHYALRALRAALEAADRATVEELDR
jgi:RNA polymerase sigma-70 factor (ECF subfamily)